MIGHDIIKLEKGIEEMRYNMYRLRKDTEELKRKLRERQAEALAALQKRSGYQMKEKRDKGLELLVHTNLLSLESKVQEVVSKFVLYKFVNRRTIEFL